MATAQLTPAQLAAINIGEETVNGFSGPVAVMDSGELAARSASGWSYCNPAKNQEHWWLGWDAPNPDWVIRWVD